jgi:hypothetical protein
MARSQDEHASRPVVFIPDQVIEQVSCSAKPFDTVSKEEFSLRSDILEEADARGQVVNNVRQM